MARTMLLRGSGHVKSYIPSYVQSFHRSIRIINHDHSYSKTKQSCNMLFPLNEKLKVINLDHQYSTEEQSCSSAWAKETWNGIEINVPRRNKMPKYSKLSFPSDSTTTSFSKLKTVDLSGTFDISGESKLNALIDCPSVTKPSSSHPSSSNSVTNFETSTKNSNQEKCSIQGLGIGQKLSDVWHTSNLVTDRMHKKPVNNVIPHTDPISVVQPLDNSLVSWVSSSSVKDQSPHLVSGEDIALNQDGGINSDIDSEDMLLLNLPIAGAKSARGGTHSVRGADSTKQIDKPSSSKSSDILQAHKHLEVKAPSIPEIDNSKIEGQSEPVLGSSLEIGHKPNVSLHPAKMKLVDKISNDLPGIKPKAVCAVCGRIMYMRVVNWAVNLPEEEWLAKELIPEHSPFQILTKKYYRRQSVSVCATCKEKVKSRRHIRFNFFNDYGQRPGCMLKLSSYSQYRKMSIGNLYCSTFKNRGYSYLHLHGQVHVQKNSKENMRGMVGVFQDGDCSELEVSTKEVIPCIKWLRKNNPLYEEFLSNLETIHGYAETKSASGLFCGLPTKTMDLNILNDGQLSSCDISKKSGLLIPADKFNAPKEPCNLDDVVIGKAVERKNDAPKVKYITYGDLDLEAKIFPHLFPFGKGSWSHQKGALTLGHYHKHRLLHVDRRWANDRLYPFFAFDRNMKARLNHINAALASNKNRDAPLKSATLSEKATYYMYGNVVNATVIGSKAYWEKNLLDLVARVSKFGSGDIFFTLTFNEDWEPLKDILSQYDNKASVLHPVEPAVYFYERFHAVKSILLGKDSVFGEVEHYWYRTKAQNRGALHFHGILWLKENTLVKDSIVAELPRGDDPETQKLRKMVKKYQTHNCLPNRCFRTWKGVATNQCKYGFPYPLRDDDGLDSSGNKIEYKRTSSEDSRIVPYNPYLLMAWDGHLNVQRITTTGLERYLVKYVSKVEPTFGLEVQYDSEVSKYLESRLVGAPEAVAMELGLTMVTSSDQVKFIDTNFPHERTRPLKRRSDIEQLNPESKDVFLDGPREAYEKRPRLPEFDGLDYPTYICGYNLLSQKPKIKNPPTDEVGRFVVKKTKPLIPRHRFLKPTDDKEAFYYQQLLLKVPFRCEKDLISPDNESRTFKEECYIRELFIKEDELDITFQEMKSRNFDPYQIAKIAKKMLHEGMTDAHTLSKKIRDAEYGEEIPFDDTELESYQSVPLEEPQMEMHADIQKLVVYNRMKILEDKKDLAAKIDLLTKSQRIVYDYISNHSSEHILAFVTGPGGTGKSFLLRTIVLFLESAANMVEVLATSGNAAQLIGGQTIHSFFRLSTELEKLFNYRDQTWSAIACTDVIIIDEVSMMSAELLETLDLICREVSGSSSSKPFGGKSIILFGDLYQLPAVISKPCFRQIYSTPIWPKFKPFFLKDNCRQKGDLKFQDILNRIREGFLNQDDIDVLETRVCGKGHERTTECDDLASPYAFVLCSKHVDRQKINEEVQESTLKGRPLFQLRAWDYDASGNRLSSEHSEDMDIEKGIMPKVIAVRLGAKVMITRNLDVIGGVVNGTIGILQRAHRNVLMIERLDGSDVIPVPKVKQRVKLRKNGMDVYRVQFPIMLAWACTVHKAQGMTLGKCFVHMDSSFFAAGQAYVALSRVSRLDELHLLSFSAKAVFANPVVSDIMNHAKETGDLKIAKTQKRMREVGTDFGSTQNDIKSEQISDQGNEQADNKHQKKVFLRVEEEIAVPMPTVSASHKVALDKGPSISTLPMNEAEKRLLQHSRELDAMQHQTYNTLRTKISHSFFNPVIRPECVTGVFEMYRPTFAKYSFLLQSLPAYVLETEEGLDVHVQGELHPAILENYCPIKTTGDGNCMWNAISLCIFNSEVHRLTLRLLTVECLWTRRDFFLYLIGMDTIVEEDTLLQRLYSQVRIARNDRQWGNEFHLLALSIVLQRDIFVYSSFRIDGLICLPSATTDGLKDAFGAHEHLGGHLFYTTPLQFRTSRYLEEPLCIHFDMRRSHYTGLLKKRENAAIFRPNTNLFNY